MPINKICFVYPTLYREGMTREESCIPSPLVGDVVIGQKRTVIVNVGMMISLKEMITLRAVIFPVGKPEIDSSIDDTGRFEHLQANILSGEQAIFLSSLYINDVIFSETGLYEINVTLLEGVTDNKQSGTAIEEYKSNFYVLTRSEV